MLGRTLKLTSTNKYCSRCDTTKPRTEFHKGCHLCKLCIVEYNKEWRKANPDKWRKQLDRQNNAWRPKHLLQKYNLTLDQYEKLCKKQKHACFVCKGPPNGRSHYLQVDHDHTTNEVRKLLCHNCNSALGLLMILR